jgi:chemotaxis protein MotB
MKLSGTILKFMIVIAAAGMLTSCISKKKYEEAMTRAAAEKSALESNLASLQEENDKLKGDLTSLEQNLNMKTEEIVSLSEKVKASNAQISALKSAISEAFASLDADDVTVEERNGKLYISMANKVLFEAGRDRLKSEAKDVLATLAGVLKSNSGLMINIEGHTDNDPVKIHKGKYQDNWGLSVARSSTVLRELVSNGVTPSRLTAAGKGDTQPIASNDTEEGKDKNRRTEFVVIPKIDGLYKMYKSDFAGMGGSN